MKKLLAKIQEIKTPLEKSELAQYGRTLPELQRYAGLLLYGWTQQKRGRGDHQLHTLAEPLCNAFLECVLSRDSEALRKLAKFIDRWKMGSKAKSERYSTLVTLAEISRSRKESIPTSLVMDALNYTDADEITDERKVRKYKAQFGFFKGKPGRKKRVK